MLALYIFGVKADPNQDETAKLSDIQLANIDHW